MTKLTPLDELPTILHTHYGDLIRAVERRIHANVFTRLR